MSRNTEVTTIVDALRKIQDQDDEMLVNNFILLKNSTKIGHAEKMPPKENFPLVTAFYEMHGIKSSHILNHYSSLNKQEYLDKYTGFYNKVKKQIFPIVAADDYSKGNVVLEEMKMDGILNDYLEITKPAFCNNQASPTVKLNISVKFPILPVTTRVAIAQIDNCYLMSRHDGTEFHFGTQKPIIMIETTGLILTMWIDIDKATQNKSIRWGTGYPSDSFPFTEAAILPALFSPRVPPAEELRTTIKSYLRLLDELKETYHDNVIKALV
jgi:hypothetical protein